MLSDDDTYGILIFDKTSGFIKLYEQNKKTHWKILHDTIEKFIEIRGLTNSTPCAIIRVQKQGRTIQ